MTTIEHTIECDHCHRTFDATIEMFLSTENGDFCSECEENGLT